MSVRNPVTGKRRPCHPGDRLRYILPAGPPMAAIEAYGHDVQSAISAGLTLLALSMAGGLSVTPSREGEASKIRMDPDSDIAAIAAQEFD